MSEQITRTVFDRLVELAALELNEKESEYIRGELNKQLTSIHELEAIPLDESTPVASHGVPYTLLTSPALRPDIIASHPNPARLLQTAPEVEGGYIVVPEIPHQNL